MSWPGQETPGREILRGQNNWTNMFRGLNVSGPKDQQRKGSRTAISRGQIVLGRKHYPTVCPLLKFSGVETSLGQNLPFLKYYMNEMSSG